MTIFTNIKTGNRISIMLVFLVYLFLLFRLIWFVNINSVNVLFWDQWDFLSPVFSGSHNLWEIFSHQHGPHRQGLGGIIQAVIYPLSGWNVRVESFLAVAILALSCWIALIIKKRLWGTYTWGDMVIPLIYFTLLQYEIFIATPNLAHGALPVLLVTFSAYLLTIETPMLRAFGLAAVVFFTTYTGFAIFSGIPVMVLLLVFSIKSTNKKTRIYNIVGLGLSLVFFISFFFNYHHAPAVDCFHFPHEHPIEYLIFSISQFAWGWGCGIINIPDHPYMANIIKISITLLFLCLLVVSLIYAIKTIRFSDKKSNTIFYLAAFTIIFIIFTAIGRVCLGIGASGASRYIPYTIPAILAFYFTYLNLRNNPKLSGRLKNLILIGFLALMIFKEVNIIRQYDTIHWFRQGKSTWVECYLKHHDIEYCNKMVNFKLYPENERIVSKLEFLEERNLSLFTDRDE